MTSPFSKFTPTKINYVPKAGEVSECMSRIPAIIQHCWAWLLDPSPAAGSTFRRVFVDCFYGYDADKSDVRWSTGIDLRILNEFQQLHASHVVNLSHHPTMKNHEVAAFVTNRSQVRDPMIHFTPYYHDLIELLVKVIESGDGVLAREGAIASSNHVVLGVALTFFHELGHLYLRWVSIFHLSHKAQDVMTRDRNIPIGRYHHVSSVKSGPRRSQGKVNGVNRLKISWLVALPTLHDRQVCPCSACSNNASYSLHDQDPSIIG
jgi:hypothetical protein